MRNVTIILWILLMASAPRLLALNAPITTAGNVVTTGSTVILPITVTNFSNIASCDLKLFYNPAIATVTSVTVSSLISGANTGFNFNNTIPGAINFGWFATPGRTVPDNSVVFNIHFTKVGNGISPVTWSTVDFECTYYDGSYNELSDTPLSSFYIPGSVEFQGFVPTTIASSVTSCPGNNISVPVKVTDFNTIGAVSLTLNYDPAVLDFLPGENTSGYPGLSVNNPFAGTIIIGGFSSSSTGVTYPDNTTLCTLNFLYKGGATALAFYDDGESCEYTGPLGTPTLADYPQTTYYLDGLVGPNADTDWDGSDDTDWTNINNWTCGVPVSTSDVTIPVTPNNPVIATDVVINSLVIDAGAILTLDPAATFKVSSTLTNNAGTAGLVLKSNATQTASMLHYSDNVPATIERYIAGSAVLEGTKYHMVSAPVTQSSDPLSGLYLDSYLFQWQPTQEWYSPGIPTDIPLSSNRGYMIYYPGAGKTYTFPGLMNNGSFTAATVAGADGYDPVPNPYPSDIDWDAATGWTKTNLYNATYIWNNGNYAAYVDRAGTNGGSRYIHIGQSFFVQANAASPALIMNNEVRVHADVPFLKIEKDPDQLLRIRTEAGSYRDEMIIRVTPNATSMYDSQFDAAKFYGYEDAPQIYSVTPGQEKLSINSLKYSNDEQVIPVGFEYPVSESVTLSFDGMDSFGPETGLYLEDLVTGSTTDLRLTSGYTFNHNPANDALRFRLHLGETFGLNDPQKEVLYRIYTFNGNVYIQIPTLSGEKVLVEWYDLLGRNLGSSSFTPDNTGMITPPAGSNVVIVRVISGNTVFTQSLIIK
ncbi:MAG: hypothetical protein FD166_3537 [Bacteroidetes bacterium]|nr:MAG: hypothetical protein FD166_3537 [Bacteroidota bacterium]